MPKCQSIAVETDAKLNSRRRGATPHSLGNVSPNPLPAATAATTQRITRELLSTMPRFGVYASDVLECVCVCCACCAAGHLSSQRRWCLAARSSQPSTASSRSLSGPPPPNLPSPGPTQQQPAQCPTPHGPQRCAVAALRQLRRHAPPGRQAAAEQKARGSTDRRKAGRPVASSRPSAGDRPQHTVSADIACH
jgi:hypothetical protein